MVMVVVVQVVKREVVELMGKCAGGHGGRNMIACQYSFLVISLCKKLH